MDAFVYILAHAEPLLERWLEFTELELHAAVGQLKDQLPDEAREKGVFADLYFAKHTLKPFSPSLLNILTVLATAGINLPTLRIGGTLRLHYRLESEEARWARDEYQFSSDDVALLGPLVPFFVRCLNTAIARRGDSKQ